MKRTNGSRVLTWSFLALCVSGASMVELRGGDCNVNGIPDTEEVAQGDARDCDGDGVPDECELGFPAGALRNWVGDEPWDLLAVDIDGNGAVDVPSPSGWRRTGPQREGGRTSSAPCRSAARCGTITTSIPPCGGAVGRRPAGAPTARGVQVSITEGKGGLNGSRG